MNNPPKLVPIEPEYVYVTIPAEYICIYHRILRMMADLGELMLKDCKVTCQQRNSDVVECFTMFNAAVAARKLGKQKLADTLIKYIKAKIGQMTGCYTWSRCDDVKRDDYLPHFVFPIDETGRLRALVSCGERPRFEINPDDMHLYRHKFNNGFDEHFGLSPVDMPFPPLPPHPPVPFKPGLHVQIYPWFEFVAGKGYPKAVAFVTLDGNHIPLSACLVKYYFDGLEVENFESVTEVTEGSHTFKVEVIYNDEVVTDEATADFYAFIPPVPPPHPPIPPMPQGLLVFMTPRFDIINNEAHAKANIVVMFNGQKIALDLCDEVAYFFDDVPVEKFEDITDTTLGMHNFKVSVRYMGVTKVVEGWAEYKTLPDLPPPPPPHVGPGLPPPPPGAPRHLSKEEIDWLFR